MTSFFTLISSTYHRTYASDHGFLFESVLQSSGPANWYDCIRITLGRLLVAKEAKLIRTSLREHSPCTFTSILALFVCFLHERRSKPRKRTRYRLLTRARARMLAERATSEQLEAEDWALNMEICDMINETDEG